MYNYNYLKDFDEFHLLNESLSNFPYSACNKAFVKGGPIKFSNGESVDPKKIIKVCIKAITYLKDEFPSTIDFASMLNIILLRYSSRYKTMAVDKSMNMYINASFVYNTLQMNHEYVAAIIMHEIFHVVYNHIQRGSDWVAAQGKKLTPQLNYDNNLAADVEVNQTLVNLNVVTEEVLTKELHGLYLKRLGGSTSIVPMEVILENDKYMNKLRSICPPTVDPDEPQMQPEIKTTEEWNRGYKDGWDKIAKLINKHGYTDAWDILLKAGIVSGSGEIDMEKDIDDIPSPSLDFLQIKSYEDFINESFKDYGDEKDMGKTYKNGFITGMSKIISKLHSAIEPQEGMNGGGGGPILDTELTPNDLIPVNLPLPETDETDGSENKKGVPENVNNTNKNKKSDKSQENKNNSEGQGQQSSGQGEGQGQQSSGQGTGQGKGHGTGKSNDLFSGIGGTGLFANISVDDVNKMLKESFPEEEGYTQDDIDPIKESINDNKENITPYVIEDAKEEMRKNLKGGRGKIIADFMDKIELNSSEYKNIWKDIMKKFMKDKKITGGNEINGDNTDWLKRSRFANGIYGLRYKKVDKEPQDVNVYVDVSGSVNMDLLEIIIKSLVVFSQEFKYSGINICPWASNKGKIKYVNDFSYSSEKDVMEKIIDAIEKGAAYCGGGTEKTALIDGMVDIVVNTVNDSNNKNKNDVHVVITDGQIWDLNGIEKEIENTIYKNIKHAKYKNLARLTTKNTFWMIYDADVNLKKNWKNEIKNGKLIFINSEIAKKYK